MGVERRGCVVQGVFIDQPEMGGISEYHQAISLAEQWEPDELRGSRPVLRAAGGEIPPADSPRQFYDILQKALGYKSLQTTNRYIRHGAPLAVIDVMKSR